MHFYQSFNYLCVCGTAFSLRVELSCENRFSGVHNALENIQKYTKCKHTYCQKCMTFLNCSI